MMAVDDVRVVDGGVVGGGCGPGEPQEHAHEPGWLELRDALGKLQAKWDPVNGVLEIQRRGVKTRYWLVFGERSGTISANQQCFNVASDAELGT